MDELEDTPINNKKEGVGPIVGTIVVVILIALGGLYFFMDRAAKLHNAPQDLPSNS